jgi:hypothetical protein
MESLPLSYNYLSRIYIDATVDKINANVANPRPEDSFYDDTLGGSASCDQCGADLLDDLLEGSPSAGLQNESNRAQRDRRLCETCSPRIGSSGLMLWDLHDRFDISDTSAYGWPSTIVEDEAIPIDYESMSTKIKALIVDLVKHRNTEKRYVISMVNLKVPSFQMNDAEDSVGNFMSTSHDCFGGSRYSHNMTRDAHLAICNCAIALA